MSTKKTPPQETPPPDAQPQPQIKVPSRPLDPGCLWMHREEGGESVQFAQVHVDSGSVTVMEEQGWTISEPKPE